MGERGGPSYDGDAMKAVAGGTKDVSGTLGEIRQNMSEKTMTSKAFGKIGDQSNIKGVFDATWNQLMTSVGSASQQFSKLAKDVESSYKEMDSRDQGNADDIKKSGEA